MVGGRGRAQEWFCDTQVKNDAGTKLSGERDVPETPSAMQEPRFDCDFRQVRKPFPHFWEHTVGSGHAPLALRADWQAQMLRCRQELGFQYVRFHAILSDEMGTLLCEENHLLYLFFNADQIVDFLLSIGMKPFVELSFMPEALASGSTTVFSYRGNVTPPKDYDQWNADSKAGRTLGLAVRSGRGSHLVFRGLERTQSGSLLDGRARRLLPALPLHGCCDQRRGCLYQGGWPGDRRQ